MVRKLSSNLSIPMFVKIRLLDTVPDTIRLCTQLAEAGAALITIHGRYRVNLVGRTGAGARDGAAHLDQIRDVKAALLAKGISIPIIANGNVITWEDVTANRELTQTEGVMSAEGLLDDPALFFPALRERGQREGQCACGSDDSIVAGDAEGTSKKKNKKRKRCTCSLGTAPTEKPSKLTLAKEYLDLVDKHPAKMKTVIFHCRRMCREELNRYQLMDDCLAATCVAEVRAVIEQAEGYLSRGDFVFDAHKEKRAKEAIERRKREEGKRKAFEERMMRKAKREGKDLDFYLQRGAEPPSAEDLLELKQMTKEEAFAVWRSRFGQNCFAYHFESGGCTRERTCAFLHVDVSYTEATAFG
jgi:tRNA-dihydrouridine synthase